MKCTNTMAKYKTMTLAHLRCGDTFSYQDSPYVVIERNGHTEYLDLENCCTRSFNLNTLVTIISGEFLWNVEFE